MTKLRQLLVVDKKHLRFGDYSAKEVCSLWAPIATALSTTVSYTPKPSKYKVLKKVIEHIKAATHLNGVGECVTKFVNVFTRLC